MTIRSALVTIHLWIGLLAAPVLLVLGVTGALLVIEAPVADRLDAATSLVTPREKALPIADLVASAKRTYPNAQLVGVQLADDRAHSVALTVATGPTGVETLLMDPYTGNVLGTQSQQQTVFRRVRQLHRQLLMGPGGNVVVITVAGALVLLALSGPVVWWPRRRVRVRWERSGWRRILDLHAVLGAVSFAFLLVFAGTGLVVHWDDATQTIIGGMTGRASPRPPRSPNRTPCDGPAALDADQLLAAGARTFPGAHAMSLQLPCSGGTVARLSFKYPEDRTPNGRSVALIDASTGKATFAVSTRSAPVAYLYPREWNRELHTGDVFGWPTQVLAFVFSLCLSAMAVTGPAVWVMRRRVRSAAHAPAAREPRGGRRSRVSPAPATDLAPTTSEAFAEATAEES